MIYILLVNYNSFSDTEECINSLLQLSYHNYRILVVDNSDSTEYVEQLKKDYPFNSVVYYQAVSYEQSSAKIVFIKAEKNKGFAAANNVGLKYIYQQGNLSYVWLLNNDTIVDMDALSHLVNKMESDSNIAICGVKLMEYYEKNVIQGIAGIYNETIAKVTFVGKHAPENSIFTNIRIDYIPGASMFLNSRFLYMHPYMCEDYFLYFEELDWSQKVKQCGMKLSIALNAKVYHKGGSTISGKSQTLSKLAEYYQSRNKIVFTYKYYKQYLPLVCLTFIPIFLNRIIRNETYKIPIMTKAVIDGLKWIYRFKKTS